jgi:hypothetical protein
MAGTWKGETSARNGTVLFVLGGVLLALRTRCQLFAHGMGVGVSLQPSSMVGSGVGRGLSGTASGASPLSSLLVHPASASGSPSPPALAVAKPVGRQ